MSGEGMLPFPKFDEQCAKCLGTMLPKWQPEKFRGLGFEEYRPGPDAEHIEWTCSCGWSCVTEPADAISKPLVLGRVVTPSEAEEARRDFLVMDLGSFVAKWMNRLVGTA